MNISVDPIAQFLPETKWLFVASNVGILLGYLAVATALQFGRFSHLFQRRLTRVSGSVFFVTCGLHHLENAVHLVYRPEHSYEQAMLTPHMLIIDAPQTVAIWVFSYSVYTELSALMRKISAHEKESSGYASPESTGQR